ncbi:MAG TPA: GNAT family N-acetyltransferase [Pirellulales bacterium]
MLMRTTLAGPLDVVELVGERELPAIAEEWNALAGEIAFRRYEWLATWWRNYRQPGDELLVVALRDAAGSLAGLAPWYVARNRWSGRVVRTLGSGKVCSEYLTVLCHADTVATVAQRLAEWLVDEGRDHWDLIEFCGVACDDPVMAALAGQMGLRRHMVHQRRQHATWRLELPETWDELLSRLSGKRRSRVRAAERRMFDSGRAVVHRARSAADIHEGLGILQHLHEQRRQSLDDAGCFSTPRFREFMHDAAERFLEADRLQLDWLQIDGRPAAVEFKLLGGDTVYYYQTGMEPSLAGESPGWLLQIASLRRAIDEGHRWFDFLRGDEGYKSAWGAGPLPLADLRIVNRRLLAQWRHRLWLAGSRIKHWRRANAENKSDLTTETGNPVIAASVGRPS